MRISDQEYNRLTVLRKLREAEPASRTDLVALSGLTGGSITTITADLVRRGLVIEEKVENHAKGRPRVNLRINPDGAYAAAASVTMVGGLRLSVVNLKGEVVHSTEVEVEHDRQLETLARVIARHLGETIAASKVPIEKFARIGIGLPALIDSRTDNVMFIHTFAPGPCDFAGIVEAELGIPTSIDNDINLLAHALHWFGGGDGFNDFTLVVVDLGIGAARYGNGKLLVGSHGMGTELGHIKIVADNGDPCYCGARGCLQAYSSMSGILKTQFDPASDAHLTAALTRREFAALIAAAVAGDAEALDRLALAGRYLGVALANHVNMQDPERVVILTSSDDFARLISPHVHSALDECTLPILRGRAEIVFDRLTPTIMSQGAAALVLEKLYQ